MSNILFWLYAKIQRLKEIPWGLSITGCHEKRSSLLDTSYIYLQLNILSMDQVFIESMYIKKEK